MTSQSLVSQLQDSLVASYRQLVRDLVKGKKADREKTEGLLVALGRTPAELESDVARERRRLELIDQANAKKTLAREIEKIHSELARLREEFTARKTEYKERVRQLNRQLRQLNDQAAVVNSAFEELLGMNPELAQRYRDVTGEIGALHVERQHVAQRITDLEVWNASKLQAFKAGQLDVEQHILDEHLEKHRKEIADGRKRLEEIESRLASLDAEAREIVKRIMDKSALGV